MENNEFNIKVSSVHAFDKKYELLCPICGRSNAGNYQHFLSDPKIEVRHEDTNVIIEFSGECGHNWSLNFGFHKGNIGVSWNKLAGSMYEDEGVTCMDCHKLIVVDKKRCLSCAVKI